MSIKSTGASLSRYFGAISMWSVLLNSIQICVYILGIFLLVWFAIKVGTSMGSNTWPPSGEKIGSWAQVVIAYAAIFAVGQYAVAYADIADKKTKSVLDFVKFFRETVLEKTDELKFLLRKNKISLPILSLRKNTPPLRFTEEEFFTRIAPNQNNDLIRNYTQLVADHPDIESKVISCLNAAEEFSIGILNSNSQDHKAVTSIKKPFVEIVEVLAIPLYSQIGITENNFLYLSKLYRIWKGEVGFCAQNQDDRLERYKEKRDLFKQRAK